MPKFIPRKAFEKSSEWITFKPLRLLLAKDWICFLKVSKSREIIISRWLKLWSGGQVRVGPLQPNHHVVPLPGFIDYCSVLWPEETRSESLSLDSGEGKKTQSCPLLPVGNKEDEVNLKTYLAMTKFKVHNVCLTCIAWFYFYFDPEKQQQSQL